MALDHLLGIKVESFVGIVGNMDISLENVLERIKLIALLPRGMHDHLETLVSIISTRRNEILVLTVLHLHR